MESVKSHSFLVALFTLCLGGVVVGEQLVTQISVVERGTQRLIANSQLITKGSFNTSKFPPDPVFSVYTAEEVRSLLNERAAGLSKQISELSLRLDRQQNTMNEMREQLLKRFEQLPLDLARDEAAYNLLQSRLKEELAKTLSKPHEVRPFQ